MNTIALRTNFPLFPLASPQAVRVREPVSLQASADMAIVVGCVKQVKMCGGLPCVTWHKCHAYSQMPCGQNAKTWLGPHLCYTPKNGWYISTHHWRPSRACGFFETTGSNLASLFDECDVSLQRDRVGTSGLHVLRSIATCD